MKYPICSGVGFYKNEERFSFLHRASIRELFVELFQYSNADCYVAGLLL